MLQGIQIDVQQVMPLAVATGLFISLCTAQSASGGLTPDGVPDNTYVDVAGLVDIPCMDAPLAPGTIDATETKELEDILSKSFRHVALSGWYPQFIAGQTQGWRVTIDGTVYDLMGAEQDSQRTQTRLKLELATL